MTARMEVVPAPSFPMERCILYQSPVVTEEKPIHYQDLHHGNINIGKVVEDLTKGRHEAWNLAGLDPDVRRAAVPRYDGWRGLFGQADASQGHLANQRVRAGDLFLFFGLFRRVKETQVGWRFVRDAPRLHMLWGWLQIEQICRVDEIRHDAKFDWAVYHCHFSWYDDPSNTLYLGTNQLDLSDNTVSACGYGVFSRSNERLVLTEPGGSVSQWRLPRWFYPDGNKTPLTYHSDPKRWRRDDEYAYLQSVGRGQEFVLDLQEYPEGLGWVSGLFRDIGVN